MAKLCAKIASPQFCLRNRRSAMGLRDAGPQTIDIVLCCSLSTKTFLQVGYEMWYAGCQLPKAASLQLPLRKFLHNSLSRHIFVVFTLTVDLILVPTSQIFVDLLTSSQLPLRAFSGPSDLYLQTQSPPFILCKTC